MNMNFCTGVHAKYQCLLLPFSFHAIVIQCPGLPPISNGAVDLSRGTKFKCTAVYGCNTGYVLNGIVARTCQEDQTWSGTEPTCDGMFIHIHSKINQLCVIYIILHTIK